MSTFVVPVVRLEKMARHPNADTLSITTVEGGPVIFRSTDFKEGDVAVYFPIDSVLSQEFPWVKEHMSFLKFNASGKHRVKAIRLRGIFSMGLLIPAAKLIRDPEGQVGQNMAMLLGVEKYEEVEPVHMNTANEPDPGFMPQYDMESYRKHKSVLQAGEEVVCTEKRHGCNARFCYQHGRLWVGSHRCIKKMDERNLWWKMAKDLGLEEKLASIPGYVLYGEIFGDLQDLKYGAKAGEFFFEAFDIFSPSLGKFLDYDRFMDVCGALDIPTVPVLYRGPYSTEIEDLANGQSTSASHIREGIVIKPAQERWNYETGRTILKLVSEQYLLRKDGSELH